MTPLPRRYSYTGTREIIFQQSLRPQPPPCHSLLLARTSPHLPACASQCSARRTSRSTESKTTTQPGEELPGATGPFPARGSAASGPLPPPAALHRCCEGPCSPQLPAQHVPARPPGPQTPSCPGPSLTTPNPSEQLGYSSVSSHPYPCQRAGAGWCPGRGAAGARGGGRPVPAPVNPTLAAAEGSCPAPLKAAPLPPNTPASGYRFQNTSPPRERAREEGADLSRGQREKEK